jgi:hypothetical protein
MTNGRLMKTMVAMVRCHHVPSHVPVRLTFLRAFVKEKVFEQKCFLQELEQTVQHAQLVFAVHTVVLYSLIDTVIVLNPAVWDEMECLVVS